jgi:hypothetical protein
VSTTICAGSFGGNTMVAGLSTVVNAGKMARPVTRVSPSNFIFAAN